MFVVPARANRAGNLDSTHDVRFRAKKYHDQRTPDESAPYVLRLKLVVKNLSRCINLTA